MLAVFAVHAAAALDTSQRALTQEQVAGAVSEQVTRFAGGGAPMGESGVRSQEKTVANGLTFSGNFSYERTGGTVILRMARIDNDSATRTTGTLRIELWASSTRPAEGQGFTGYKLATGASLNPLAPRTFYTDVVRTTSFVEPPAGTYWMVMVLSEFSSACSQSDGFCLTDSGIFSTQQTFGSAPPPPSSGNLTIISRVASQCYENIPREVYDFLITLLPPGTFEQHSALDDVHVAGHGILRGIPHRRPDHPRLHDGFGDRADPVLDGRHHVMPGRAAAASAPAAAEQHQLFRPLVERQRIGLGRLDHAPR
jgi:hypothetical protein